MLQPLPEQFPLQWSFSSAHIMLAGCGERCLCLPFSQDSPHFQILVLSQRLMLFPVSSSNLDRQQSLLTRAIVLLSSAVCAVWTLSGVVRRASGQEGSGQLLRHFSLHPMAGCPPGTLHSWWPDSSWLLVQTARQRRRQHVCTFIIQTGLAL